MVKLKLFEIPTSLVVSYIHGMTIIDKYTKMNIDIGNSGSNKLTYCYYN